MALIKKGVLASICCSLLLSNVSFAFANYESDVENIISMHNNDDEDFNWDILELDGAKIKYENVVKIMEETDLFIKNNPKKSQSQINNFVDERINKYKITRFKRGWLDDLVKNKLNPKELKLYRQNKRVAFTIALAAKTAGSEAKARYEKKQLFRGNGDAFRHAYWNALMARDVGNTWALKWGDAHEYGEKNNNGIDRKMDLYNNRKGREANDGSNNRNLAAIIRYEVRKGYLKRIVNDKLTWTDSSGEK